MLLYKKLEQEYKLQFIEQIAFTICSFFGIIVYDSRYTISYKIKGFTKEVE